MAKKEIKLNFIDKAINFVAPRAGLARKAARTTSAMVDEYIGASKRYRSMFDFNPTSQSPDDTADQLTRATLIERSRWLARNNPLASGTIETNGVYIIGPGLKPKARVDRKFLGISNEEADSLETEIEREFGIWADSPDCDIERTINFYDKQNQMLMGVFEAGDILTYLPFIQRNNEPYGLKLQSIEAERLCNENFAIDSDRIIQGVEKDDNGAPVKYHICSVYPTNLSVKQRKWEKVDAYKSNGLKNILHHYIPKRPGQTRGISYLTPIIDLIYTMGNLRKAELDAMVVQSLFAVFIKTASGKGLQPMAPRETGAKKSDEDVKLSPGAIIDLRPGEEATFAKPERPNPNFDAFLNSLYQECGVGLLLPAQIMMKNYNTSYTSARAAFLDAWKFYLMRRVFCIRSFCNPVYENWMFEAVIRNRLKLPGFLNDIRYKKAYLGVQWIGPSQGQINPVDEMTAAQMADDYGYKTSEQITEETFGGDFNDNIEQKTREIQMKKAADMYSIQKPINLTKINAGQ